MSTDLPSTENEAPHHGSTPAGSSNADRPPEANDADGDLEDDSDGDGDDDEEPKLKYARLTGSLTNVYRNGDSSSAVIVAGDKMAMGTHDGNVHVLSLPTLQSLKTYHAHSATVTSVSVSPTPPPPSPANMRNADSVDHAASSPAPSTLSRSTSTVAASSPKRQQRPQQVIPNTPNNAVYIATSSLDGYVCIASLVDYNDVQRRNFSRPVNAVALSPEYKSDRMYLSGGLAGQLILTTGGKSGTTTEANTNSAAAAASGWLGSIGLGGDKGKDQVLHSGEGAISAIRWSLSGKWVVWVNEEGIKIMRSPLRLGSENSEDAWKRIAHAGKPNLTAWEGMEAVWKAKCEWIDERRLEADNEHEDDVRNERAATGINGAASFRPSKGKRAAKIEKLVVGWGNTAWLIHVHEDLTIENGKRKVGSADVIHKLHFRDCIISGISLYTPSLLAILAYRTLDDNDQPIKQQRHSGPSEHRNSPRKGRHHRQTGLAPQLRLVNVVNGEEDEVDELSISRFETLSAQDYHLTTLYIPRPPPSKPVGAEKGALEGFWDVTGGKYTPHVSRMFSSGASVMSGRSSEREGGETGGSVHTPPGSSQGVTPTPQRRIPATDAHPFASATGLKFFIHSPYDCVLAVKRDLSDRLDWLLDHEQYAEAWALIDERPEIVEASTTEQRSLTSPTDSPSRANGSLAEFFADNTTSQVSRRPPDAASIAQKEKLRIGNLWIEQLVAVSHWEEAGRIAGKVLGSSARWEYWVRIFARAGKFDEITPYIPSPASMPTQPPLPSVVYELILGHYLRVDPPRLKDLLEEWNSTSGDPDVGPLFDLSSVIAAIEDRFESGEVTEQTKQGGERGYHWRLLMECLAELYLADGRPRDALRCYIRVQNADVAMALIKEEQLIDIVANDVPGLLMLRISKEMMHSASLSELEEASGEALRLLVEEALRGSVTPATVIQQLLNRGDRFRPFLFFYLRALWNGVPKDERQAPRSKRDRQVDEGHALVEDHPDLAVELFAEYDRELLRTFLRTSEVYNYDKAAKLCEERHYITELVDVLAKTGLTQRALSLIIDELDDVAKAIKFAKEHTDLWDDLLEYSMKKPRFIRGLLTEVGTSMDPIKLVRRIPEGVEIEGLREGIAALMREYDVQKSISEGVAKVLRGEVATGMDTLRAGQKKGVRFDAVREGEQKATEEAQAGANDVQTEGSGTKELKKEVRKEEETHARLGRCVGCGKVFNEDEQQALIGFACGHVYHLSCLLKCHPDTADDETLARLESQLGYGEGKTTRDGPSSSESPDEREYASADGSRSVGAKVAHAHIIKNVVRGGCRHCGVSEA